MLNDGKYKSLFEMINHTFSNYSIEVTITRQSPYRVISISYYFQMYFISIKSLLRIKKEIIKYPILS